MRMESQCLQYAYIVWCTPTNPAVYLFLFTHVRCLGLQRPSTSKSHRRRNGSPRPFALHGLYLSKRAIVEGEVPGRTGGGRRRRRGRLGCRRILVLADGGR